MLTYSLPEINLNVEPGHIWQSHATAEFHSSQRQFLNHSSGVTMKSVGKTVLTELNFTARLAPPQYMPSQSVELLCNTLQVKKVRFTELLFSQKNRVAVMLAGLPAVL